MIAKYQGETIQIEKTVLDDELGTPADLSGCTIDVSYVLDSDWDTVYTHSSTINGNTIYVKFLPSETAIMLGRYIVDIKIKDIAHDVDLIKREIIHIEKAVNPNF